MNRSKRTALTGTVFTVSLLLLLACAPASDQDLALPPGTATPTTITPAEPTHRAALDTDTPAAATPMPQTQPPAPATSTPAAPPDTPQPPPTDARVERPTPGVTHFPERVPNVTETPITGEVPAELLAAIIADLAASQRVAPADITVVRAEAVRWNDGSLGCPEPGMNYLMVEVNGYWVVLEHGGETFDYRATQDGYFRLCPDPAPAPPSPTDGTS